jgi:hypothetical protein
MADKSRLEQALMVVMAVAIVFVVGGGMWTLITEQRRTAELQECLDTALQQRYAEVAEREESMVRSYTLLLENPGYERPEHNFAVNDSLLVM